MEDSIFDNTDTEMVKVPRNDVEAELAYTFSTMPLDELIVYVRRQRNIKLEETDWTVLPDSPLSEDLKQQFRVYRQALRDITIGLNSYQNLVWPIKPA